MNTKTGRCQDLEENSGRKRQGHRNSEEPATGETPRFLQGTGCRPRAEKGGANQHGNENRRRHAELSIGKNGGGWRAAGAGDFQLGGDSHRERWWVAGKNLEGFKEERLQMGRR